MWADHILAEQFRASTHFQRHLSHSILGAVLRWFQRLCLLSKQKLFRWEQFQLEVSMIFTWPLNTPDLQFPSFSNESLDLLGEKKLNSSLALPLSWLPSSPFSGSTTHPFPHGGPPSIHAWLRGNSPSTSHRPQPETLTSFFFWLRLTLSSECSLTLAFGHRSLLTRVLLSSLLACFVLILWSSP